jgi:small-conductance mechanosensitive channel
MGTSNHHVAGLPCHGSDVQKVRNIMLDVTAAHALVLNEPASDVIFE